MSPSVPSDLGSARAPSRASTPGLAAALLLASVPLAAGAQEAPVVTGIVTNAPGLVTVAWAHTCRDVEGFVVQRKAPPFTYRPLVGCYGGTTIHELSPSTTYEFRVCAVYAGGAEACSHAGDAQWATVTTMPPERPPLPEPPRPAPTPPPPTPRPIAGTPQLRALAFRLAAGGPIVVELRWVNQPVDEQRQFVQADWMRGGRLIHSGIQGDPPSALDYDMSERRVPEIGSYQVCVRNDVSRACSVDEHAGYLGVAESFRTFARDKFMTHSSWQGWVDLPRSPEASAHASYIVRPGLDRGVRTVSFEVFGIPHHYFTNAGGRLRVERDDRSAQFAARASFRVRPALIQRTAEPSALSFESVSAPRHYIRHNGNALLVQPYEDSPQFREQASWEQMGGALAADPPATQLRDVGRLQVRDTPSRMPRMIRRP
jgi:hypothetical protein